MKLLVSIYMVIMVGLQSSLVLGPGGRTVADRHSMWHARYRCRRCQTFEPVRPSQQLNDVKHKTLIITARVKVAYTYKLSYTYRLDYIIVLVSLSWPSVCILICDGCA